MSTQIDPRPSLAERVAASPGDLLEQIARGHGVSPFDVVRSLPSAQATIVPAESFSDSMQDIATWGDPRAGAAVHGPAQPRCAPN